MLSTQNEVFSDSTLKMLAAGGIEPLSDGKRKADEDNPKGYFELESATRIHRDKRWLEAAAGKTVKIVAQLLPALPKERQYRVVFMERDLDEVLKSQAVMLKRLGRPSAKLTDDQLKAAYRRQVQQVRIWIARQSNIKVLFVSHRGAVSDRATVAAQVKDFLGGDLDTTAMAGAVDDTLYRQRAG